MTAQVWDLPDGSIFRATERHVPPSPPFGSFGDGAEGEERIRAWVGEKWNTLWQLKRGEQERLKTCELFYAGFHYIDAWDNRNNPVTNYCGATVETIWPILTQTRPRPEVVARNTLMPQKADRLRDFATYKMDSCGFDRIHRICTRDLLKYGWCVPMIGWDSMGRAIPKYLSPFDFYPDMATEESELECFAIARPVSVRRLRALFPKVADKIMPDNIASPSYEVMVQPYLEQAGILGSINAPNMIGPMPSVTMEGTTATTTAEYGIDTGSFSVFGQSAFVIQLFVRDYTTMKVRYEGDRYIDHPTGTLQIPHSLTADEVCCPSGWRMIPMTASGVLLSPPMPVDVCLGGLPIVIGRNYEQGGRLLGRGELDDVIPIQRDINRSDAMIARALELQANPPVKVSLDARLNADRSSIEGGELIKIARGAILEYLQPQGLAESHFERRALRRQDVQIVAGTPDSLQGQRPVGVEAAAAIRQLTESGASRARAKGASIQEWSALMIQKLIHCDLYKSEEMIYYRANDGSSAWMNPDDYDPNDFEIRWAQASGDAQGRQDRIDEDKELLQLGAIDVQQLLDDMDYPGRSRILQRMGQQRLLMAAAQGASGGNGGGR